MKTSTAPVVGLLIFFLSIVGGNSNPIAWTINGIQSTLANLETMLFGQAKKAKAKVTAETVASCIQGEFKCEGSDKEYCREQEKLCRGGDDTCHPMCHWSCVEHKCEKACAPKCNPPVCQTRCKGFNTQSCHMKCQKPNCAVICPKKACHNAGCVKCSTQCGQPTCHLECGKDLQNCHNVCAEPLCTWECKNPESCPKPKCEMRCKEAKNCLASSVHSELPPMEKGETQVVNFEADKPKMSLLQDRARGTTMQVNITTMGDDNSLHSRQVVLPVADAMQPVQQVQAVPVKDSTGSDFRTWTSKASTLEDGTVMRSKASCQDGDFQCEGEGAWCSEQENVVCKGRTVFRQQRVRTHARLQA